VVTHALVLMLRGFIKISGIVPVQSSLSGENMLLLLLQGSHGKIVLLLLLNLLGNLVEVHGEWVVASCI
jgi:tetrahydromethanopterin S-methyltransferase subunit D